MRRPRRVQAGRVVKREVTTAMVSWRVGSRVSIGGQLGRGCWGTVGMSKGTRWVRTLVAWEVLTVVTWPDLSMACLTVGF